MKQNHAHITLVADRSGSMSSVRSDAEGAVNEFLTTQKAVPGTATLTLVEFDAVKGRESAQSGGDIPWYHEVHDGNLADAPNYHLHPRGNTALLDAIGRAINATGDRLAATGEDDRPEHVFFVVQTDGLENSSTEFTGEAIQALIKEQTDTWKWEFVFLGMGPDAFTQGRNLGFANVTRSAHAAPSYHAAYANTSDAIAGMRNHTAENLTSTNATVTEDGTVIPAAPVED